MSTTQETENKATFARLHDVVNTGDVELVSKTIDAIVHPDVRIRTPLPVPTTGAQALKQVWAILFRAFPDLHLTVEDVIAEGDKIVTRNTVTGTQNGEFMGRPPSGKSVSYNEIFIFRFAGGRVAETWGVVDSLAVMRQLDMIPA
jgi:steroid delta-isomerase-like uncharacterized protein